MIKNIDTHCVPIYPYKDGKVVYCLFPSKELKDKYIELESRAVEGFYNAWQIAIGEQRKKNKAKLLEARVAFAQDRGFEKKPSNPYIWILKLPTKIVA